MRASCRFSRRRALQGGLCGLTLCALACRLPGDAPSQTAALLPDGGLWALAAGALWLLYGEWLKCSHPFRAAGYWALAALFAAVVTLGQSYGAVGTAELVTGHPLRALLCFAGRAPLYYAGMLLLREGLHAGEPLPSVPALEGSPLPLWRRPGLRYAAGLLLCWLPYLFFLFPGTVSTDSVTQVLEIIGVEKLGNANPIFQTGLVYLFRGLGKALGSADAAVALYCGLQALLMALLLGRLLACIRRSAAPGWLCRAAFAFYAFCPIFPVFAFCMGKDTNFSMAVCWLSLLTLRLLRTGEEGEPGGRYALRLCLAAALCVLLRNPGVYLALLTLLLLLGWALGQRKRYPRLWRGPAAALATVALVFGVLQLGLIPALGLEPTPETENWSLPLQQVARVAATHPLTGEEAHAVNGVLALDKVPAAYNGELSDPIKFLWRSQATPAQKTAFFRTWRGLLAKYPATCLSATFHNTYGYLFPGYMSTIKPTLLIGRQRSARPELTAVFDYSVNPHAPALKAFTDQLAQNPLYRALTAPGLYGWLCLFACVTLLMGRPRRLGVAAVPALFSLAGCLLSAVNGYFRYAMPLYLCAPLLLWLCALTGPLAKEEGTTR